jgi:hypothetical protein
MVKSLKISEKRSMQFEVACIWVVILYFTMDFFLSVSSIAVFIVTEPPSWSLKSK